MKAGVGLTNSARAVHISPERLRAGLAVHTVAKREGKRWSIRDRRQVQLPLYSGGKVVKVVVDADNGREIGRYMAAVGRFLETNDYSHLAPFYRRGIRDHLRRFHAFEVDPNQLYALDSAGELSFPEIYRIVT
jgi:hypothetical protein